MKDYEEPEIRNKKKKVWVVEVKPWEVTWFNQTSQKQMIAFQSVRDPYSMPDILFIKGKWFL